MLACGFYNTTHARMSSTLINFLDDQYLNFISLKLYSKRQKPSHVYFYSRHDFSFLKKFKIAKYFQLNTETPEISKNS